MLGRTPARVIFVVLALVAAVMTYRWWNSPERQIGRILKVVTTAFNHDAPDAGLEALAAVAALQQHLAPDVSIASGAGSGAIAGREEVMAVAARVRAGTPMMLVQFFDADISLQGDSSAAVRATAQVTTRSQSGEDVVDVHQVSAVVEKRSNQWVVTMVVTDRNAEAGI